MMRTRRPTSALFLCLLLLPVLSAFGQDRVKEGNVAYAEATAVYQKRDYAKAMEAFTRMAQGFKGHPYQDNALYMATYCAYRLRDVAKVVEAADRHREAFPNTYYCQTSLWYAASAWYSIARDHAKAMPYLEEVAFRMPGNTLRGSALTNLLECCMRLKQYDKGLAFCDKALAWYPEASPLRIGVLQGRLRLLKANKQYDALTPTAEAIGKLAPNSVHAAQAWADVGDIRERDQKKYAAAADALLKAAETAHDLNAPRNVRQAALNLERVTPRDDRRVAAVYELYLKKYPGSVYEADVQNRLAGIYVRLKDATSEQRVREQLDRSFKTYPQNARNLILLRALYVRQKKTAEAVRLAERLIAEFPSDTSAADAMLWLVRHYVRAGDRPRAEKLREQLVDRFPDSSYRAPADKTLAK